MTLTVLSKTSLPLGSGEAQTPELLDYFIEGKRAVLHSREPESLGGWKVGLLDEAFDIAKECSEPDWDGYESTAISEEALRRTLILIQALPDFSPIPELVPAPEGEIAFEWNSESDRTLSVTPKPDRLVYAVYLGANHSNCGKVPFDGKFIWHEDILTILSRYFQYDRSYIPSA